MQREATGSCGLVSRRCAIIILQTIVVVDVKLSFSKKDLVVKMECLYFCTASKIRLFASVILVMTF